MMSSKTCIICKAGDSESKKLVRNPQIEHVEDLKVKIIERANLGDAKLRPLAEYFKSKSDVTDIAYHSECRKPIVHGPDLDRLRKRSRSLSPASISGNVPPKRGRPPKSDDGERAKRRSEKISPKEKKCMFSQCAFCSKSSEDLHLAKSDLIGLKLLTIKDSTNSDVVRIAVSDLSDAGDASALEKYYHRACLRNAERSCELKDEGDFSRNVRRVCDAEIVVYVRESLSDTGVMLTMNEINDVYVKFLNEKGISVNSDANYKKHLKYVITENIPGVDFVAPRNPSHSHKVTLKQSVSEAVEYATQTSLSSLLDVTHSLRKDVLDVPEWKFTGDFDSWTNPPLLEFVLQQILCGTKGENLSGARQTEVKKTVDVICQMIVQNSRSQRQVKLKSSRSFKQVVQTPLSIGLPLVVHSRLRDYNLVSALTTVYIGSEYRHLIDIEKRIEFAVQERMATTGGYCLPDFVRRDVPLWFAVDNIDFLENTAYGQNTLHGTLLVLFQRDEDGELINPPLAIPDKVPKDPRMLAVSYREQPDIILTPIRFLMYPFNHWADSICKYSKFTQTWALANLLGNKPATVPSTGEDVMPDGACMGDDEVQGGPSMGADDELQGERGMGEDVGPDGGSMSEDIVQNETGIGGNVQDAAGVGEGVIDEEGMGEDGQNVDGMAEDAQGMGENVVQAEPVQNTQTPILGVQNRSKKVHNLEKKDVMPTWAATQHLLIRNSNGYESPTKTNVEVVAPILRRSPTDYATLYTVLCMAQDISSVVVGPERRTLITLDMDLYQRAVQLQVSVVNTNWVLRPGLLHFTFAALHALGKAVEGSGLDTVAVETGIYSSTVLRGIYSGKKYRRGVEHHIMNCLAILLLKLEAGVGSSDTRAMKKQCMELRTALHNRDPEMIDIYGDIESHYTENIQPLMDYQGRDNMSVFLDNYVCQVEALLALIAAARSRDWEGCLAAIDNNVKYFAAFDLVNYFRMIPIHVAQMYELKTTDPTTWKALVSGDFVVTKSMQAFCNLFTDQGLEQQIKDLKRHGALPGITQDEASFDRFVTIAPHLVRMVQNFLSSFPQAPDDESAQDNHYQLSGDIGLRSSQNAMKLHDSIIVHCQGNPYTNNMPVKSIVSSAIIPERAKEDILGYPQHGQDRYEEFVQERLLSSSPKSVWDTISLMKLRRFTNWMEKTKVKVGDKIIKLREDRELIGRCLIIGQARPELMPKLEDTIGMYEMSVVPRSIFAPDGSLLLNQDKASLMHLIEEQPHVPPAEPVQCDNKPSTIIIDAMCVVQSLKKTPAMKTMLHLKTAFIGVIEKHIKRGSYSEARVIFDQYHENSLKQKTRAKRSAGRDTAGYEIHDAMSIQTLPLRDLLASTTTKRQLTSYFADGLLQRFSGNTEVKLIATHGTVIAINEPHTLPDDFTSHRHEEADTQIPLHVLNCVRASAYRHIVVESLDTDVLILLMDLVACGHLGALTSLELHTGKGKKFRKIDVVERVNSVGVRKSKGLIGLHNFTGADWGGKFVGVSKKRWASEYFKLDPDDPIVDAFIRLGTDTLTPSQLVGDELPEAMQPLEHFVCLVYKLDRGPYSLPKARWELFRTKNLESEMLPPTRGTLLPHIQRTSFVCTMNKAYVTTHPREYSMHEYGWEKEAGSEEYTPVRCVQPPAPRAVLELIKCGCKSSGCSHNCSCRKNRLPCTPLCKCHDLGCTNVVHADDDEVSLNTI